MVGTMGDRSVVTLSNIPNGSTIFCVGCKRAVYGQELSNLVGAHVVRVVDYHEDMLYQSPAVTSGIFLP